MIKCPSCGYDNKDDAQFCLNCGAPIVREKVSESFDDVSDEATIILNPALLQARMAEEFRKEQEKVAAPPPRATPPPRPATPLPARTPPPVAPPVRNTPAPVAQRTPLPLSQQQPPLTLPPSPVNRYLVPALLGVIGILLLIIILLLVFR